MSAPNWSDPRLVAAAAAYTPPAHYLRSDGVKVCCHTIPVAPGSCEDCWDLAKWDVAAEIRAGEQHVSGERDISRRYLVPVGPLGLSGEPDDLHLSVVSWEPRVEAWAHGVAICGRSVAQGELAGAPRATCESCLFLESEYREVLARHASRS